MWPFLSGYLPSRGKCAVGHDRHGTPNQTLHLTGGHDGFLWLTLT